MVKKVEIYASMYQYYYYSHITTICYVDMVVIFMLFTQPITQFLRAVMQRRQKSRQKKPPIVVRNDKQVPSVRL